MDESGQKRCKWKWMQPETVSVVDLGFGWLKQNVSNLKCKYAQVVNELKDVKEDFAKVNLELDAMKKELGELKQALSRSGHASVFGKLL